MPAEASVLGGGMTLTDTVKGAASLTARFALYPSILYNLARNRLQDNWHWWDKITEVGPSAQEQSVQQPPGPVKVIVFPA